MVGRGGKRDDLDDRRAGGPQGTHLLRVVRQQPHRSHAERRQDLGRFVVVAPVDGQPEQVVGVDRVGPVVLGDVGAQLVHQADAAALMARRVDEHATTGGAQQAQALAAAAHRNRSAASRARHR